MRFPLPLLLAATLAISGASLAADIDEDAVRSAKTTKDLAALGAVRLSAVDFKKKVVGRKLDEGGWTWVIGKDGTARSAADDKSWESAEAWSVKSDKYCREVKGSELCSEVWMAGTLVRMTEKGSKLAGWTVAVK